MAQDADLINQACEIFRQECLKQQKFPLAIISCDVKAAAAGSSQDAVNSAKMIIYSKDVSDKMLVAIMERATKEMIERMPIKPLRYL